MWATLVLLLCCVSCNKTARGRKHLEASKDAYEKAVLSLVGADIATSKSLALQAMQSAQTADKLLTEGAFQDVVSKQKELAIHLAGLFEDPRSSLLVFFDALSANDFDLLMACLDHEYMLQESRFYELTGITPEKKAELNEVFGEAMKQSFVKYAEVLATWNTQGMDVSDLDQGRKRVHFHFKALNADRTLALDMHYDDGYWRLYDFTMGQITATESFKILGARMKRDVDLIAFFRDKGLVDAFSEIEDADQIDALFAKSSMIGHYVRTLQPLELIHQKSGETILLEKGRIVKIIDQHKMDDVNQYTVRTTEADVRECAAGRVSSENVEDIGTEETEIWGTLGLDLNVNIQ